MRFAGLLLSLVIAGVALANMPGAGSLAAHAPSHAWFVLPPEDGSRLSTLLHAPGPGRATGEVRVAQRLDESVDMVCAWGDRVYLLGAPSRSRGIGPTRTLRSLAANRDAVSGAWSMSNQGRPTTHPRLDAGGLDGFCATPFGPVVLVSGAVGSGRVRVMDGERWRDVQLPIGARTARGLRLVAHPEGLGVLGAVGGRRVLWVGRGDAPGRLDWSEEETGFDRAPVPSGAFVLAGDIVFAHRAGAAVEVWSVGRDRETQLALIDNAGSSYGVAPLADAGRVLVVWRDQSAGDDASLRITEISAYTGQVLYEGAVAGRAPVSSVEFRLLLAGVAALVVIVLLAVIKTDARTALVIPEGAALAAPSQRVVAGGIDAAAAACAVSFARGASPFEVYSVRALVEPGGLGAIVALLLVGLVVGALTEWFSGRSPGKLLTGAYVARLDGSRPSFGQAFVRNGAKWLLAPLALVGASSPGGRHPGDVWSRCVVLTPLPPEPPEA